MRLDAGTAIGVYHVLGRLGEGGMGEVYRARDTTLNRDVALKILPESLRRDPDRLARFTREAHVLASLNHPNIAAIYGFHDADGAPALILELVEGSTLADRLAEGRLPVGEALSLARQMADALEAAHEKGVIHRDLKPSNVKIRPDGTLKLLDFGLARALDVTGSGDDSLASTMASPPKTEAGLLLGTPGYMSPEQARGGPVDRRTDVWSFGCVLFEMLAGVRAFGEAPTISDAIAAVLRSEPHWDALPATTPSSLRALLRRCLEKDPRKRLRDIGDVGLLLTDIATAGEDALLRPTRTSGRMASRWPAIAGWGVAALLAAALLTSGWWQRPRAVGDDTSLRLSVPLEVPLDTSDALNRRIAVSPDGRRLAYVSVRGGARMLVLLDLSTGETRVLPGTANADDPAFAPDGRLLGFVVGEALKMVPIDGGLARDLGELAGDRSGWAWLAADQVVIASAAGLSRLSISGGAPAVIASLGPDDFRFSHPAPLPGGGLLVAVRSRQATATDDQSQVAVIPPGGGERRIIAERGSSPAFVPAADGSAGSGHVLYGEAGRVMAAPFDLDQLALVGPPVPVFDGIAMRPNGDAAQISLSANGAAVFVEASEHELVRVDRDGTARPLSAWRRKFAMPRLSPDGRLLAVEIQDSPHQVWLLDLERDVLTQLTTSPGGSHSSAWSPDGRSLLVTETDAGRFRLAWLPADGSREPVAVPLQGYHVNLFAWHPQGRWLAAGLTRDGATADEGSLLGLQAGVPPVIDGPPAFLESGASAIKFSPDGEWIAHMVESPTTGGGPIVISRLADRVRHQVTSEEGTEPLWGKTGELFFRSATTGMMMAVDVDTQGGQMRLGRPQPLFEDRYEAWGNGNYDVTRDGESFVMIRRTASDTRSVSIRLNWAAELARAVR